MMNVYVVCDYSVLTNDTKIISIHKRKEKAEEAMKDFASYLIGNGELFMSKHVGSDRCEIWYLPLDEYDDVSMRDVLYIKEKALLN